jgi:hypothetical protein
MLVSEDKTGIDAAVRATNPGMDRYSELDDPGPHALFAIAAPSLLAKFTSATSTNAYTVPVAGYYQINAAAIAQTPAAAQNWAVQLFIQTTGIIAQGPISSATSGGLGTTIGVGLNDIYYFNPGDVLTVAVAYSIAPLGVGAQGGNWNFGNVQSYGEYWSLQLISA